MVKKNLIIFYLLIIFSMIGCDKKPKIRYSYKYFGFENFITLKHKFLLENIAMIQFMLEFY